MATLVRKRNYSFLNQIEDKKDLFLTIKNLMKTDLYFLCRYILNYRDLETQTSLHYRLCDLMEDNTVPRLAVMMFRGSFKTSIASAWCIQRLMQRPDAQVGIGSETQDRAKERLLDVKLILERNQLLPFFYPEVFHRNPQAEAYRWNESELYVRLPQDAVGGFRKPSISPFGLFPLPVGSHYTDAWMDDIEHEENTQTEEMVGKLNGRAAGFMPTLQDGARVVLTGTYYHPAGPNVGYSRRWPLYRVPILDKNGNPTFPSKKPIEECIRIREQDVDEWVWNTQYMLNVQMRSDVFEFPFRGKALQVCYELS